MYFFFYFEPYIAIAGYFKQQSSFSKLHNELQKINRIYKEDIAEKFHFVQEREFHGLLKNGVHLTEILNRMEYTVYPEEIFFGIGIGKVSQEESAAILWESGSSAFYNAKKAADYLQQQNRRNAAFQSSYWVISDGDNEETTDLLNTVFMLLTSIRKKWTKRQWQIISDFQRYHDSQAHVAKRLGITQSSVQKGLAGSDFYTYDAAVKKISRVFQQII